MAQLLLTRFPDRVASPGRVTDRKPGKADKDTPELQFLKPEVLAKMVAGGQMVVVVPDAAGGTSTGVTTAALAECAAAGERGRGGAAGSAREGGGSAVREPRYLVCLNSLQGGGALGGHWQAAFTSHCSRLGLVRWQPAPAAGHPLGVHQ